MKVKIARHEQTQTMTYAFVLLFSLCVIDLLKGQDVVNVQSVVELINDQAGDQDDLCFWQNMRNCSDSRVIVSDKKANFIFSYSLDGKLQQQISVPKPGNIDIRHDVNFGNRKIDIVAVNARTDGWKLRLFMVEKDTGTLKPVAGDGISTRPNYGSCLAYNNEDGRLYCVCTSESSGVTIYELSQLENGTVVGDEVGHLKLGKCEGVVADDSSGKFYVAVEDEGIWEFSFRGDVSKEPRLIIPVGRDGLQPDLEGVTLATLSDSSDVIVVSSQGINQFFVFDRQAPWRFRGNFAIDSVEGTDGIDLFQSKQLKQFPEGIFGCHSGAGRHSIFLSAWSDVSNGILGRPTKESR